jgi:UDP-N-acetylmuramoyl-L-alanyl-D-glutamate--2,6-diaminopimelate ligase
MAKELRQLLSALPGTDLRGSADTRITGIAYDSRKVAPGDLFVALEGQHTDGHRYVRQALERGAAAVLHSRVLAAADYRPDKAYLRHPDTRRVMGQMAAAFFDHPSQRLEVVGVTGTDGKSTTVWLIHQLLEALGQPSGFVSTVQVQTGAGARKNPLRQSTPESPDIQGFLADMVRSGRRYAVLEATSHGLSERTARLIDVRFRAAVCTNITHEHLEFHGSYEQYRSDKANLFRALDRYSPRHGSRGADQARDGDQAGPGQGGRGADQAREGDQAGPRHGSRGAGPREGPFGVVNLGDSNHSYLRAQTTAPVFGYGRSDGTQKADTEAVLAAEQVHADLSGSRFTLRYGAQSGPGRLNLPGMYNVENLLAAALTVLTLIEAPFARLCSLLPSLRGVPGRMQPVEAGQGFRVIVDYAHTPEAFAKVLPLVEQHTRGRLLAVFGSAGERDREKRRLQGALAARHCQVIVLADEDPRGEDPEAILREIASGCREEGQPELHLIPDRRRAVRRALQLALPGDTVLLLGKGHEDSILYADGSVPWDEAAVARELLGELGFGG